MNNFIITNQSKKEVSKKKKKKAKKRTWYMHACRPLFGNLDDSIDGLPLWTWCPICHFVVCVQYIVVHFSLGFINVCTAYISKPF